jgi:hypothetical protein
MEDIRWFPRLAEVPNIGYIGHPGVDRRTLPRHDSEPRVNTFSFDGELDRSLSWPTENGETSQSPASAWSSLAELPGTATDYHYALLRSYQVLWGLRRGQPEILADLERLCLLDIALAEARPVVARINGEGEGRWLSIPAFSYLVQLYERDGFLEDALGIAKRGAALGQGESEVGRLEERLASIRAETAS